MAYVDEIEGKRYHEHAYYLAFDGIAERFTDHHPSAYANWNPSETFYEVLVRDSLSGGGQKLDRKTNIVQPAGFGFQLADTTETRAIFRRKGGTEDKLNVSISATTTTVQLKSAAATYSNGVTIHVHKEAITLGTHGGSGVYNGCTRGALGTTAAPHRAGAVVSDVARHWRGRRARLYSVHLPSGEETAIRTAIVSDFPAHNDGVRVFSCVDLMTVLNRPILTGWEEQPIEAGYPLPTTWDFHPSGYDLDGISFAVTDARELAENGYVMFAENGETFVTALYDNQPDLDSSGVFVVTWDKLAGSSGISSTGILQATDISVRQVELIQGRLAVCALQAIQSDTGDGSNGTYDVLPGRAPNFAAATSDMTRKRGGAGIPSSWVDESSFEFIPGGRTSILLDEETRLFDFLRDEILWRANGYIYVNGSGQLAFKRYQPLTIRGSLPTLSKDEVLLTSVTSSDTESQQVAKVEFHCNYIPGEGYTRKLPVSFRDSAELYDLDPGTTVELKSKSVWVGNLVQGQTTARRTSAASVRGHAERYRANGLDGGLRLKLRLPWSKSAAFVEGYRFSYTDDRVVDAEGTKGVSAKPFEVVGTAPDYGAGTWTVDAEELRPGVRLGFSGVVASYAGSTVTLADTGPNGDGKLFDDNPAADLGAGWVVRFYDHSASPPFSSSSTETVLSASGNDIVLDSPSFTPAALDIVVLEDSDEAATTANAAGADVQDYAFGADNSDRVGTSSWERAANEWR